MRLINLQSSSFVITPFKWNKTTHNNMLTLSWFVLILSQFRQLRIKCARKTHFSHFTVTNPTYCALYIVNKHFGCVVWYSYRVFGFRSGYKLKPQRLIMIPFHNAHVPIYFLLSCFPCRVSDLFIQNWY